MLVFIDESGIHKKTDNSTFALSYIKFENYSDIETKLIEIEKKLDIEQFHWAETVWRIKEKFMNAALKLDFKAKVAIVKNPINPSMELEKILLHTIVENDIRAIYIDGKKPKWFENKIKKILRDKGMSVRKVRTVKASQCAGVRIADMIAGLARTHYDNKNSEKIDKYYKRLEKKLIIFIK